MKQAVHIFRKDAFHLRWEIALVLVMVTAFATVDAGSPADSMQLGHAQWIQILTMLLGTAWIILIARVLRSEALALDHEFWLTRPYSWKSLLAAKALFLLAFFTLPMAITDATIVTAHGFSIATYLPGLLWLQVLRWGTIVLPMVALASVISGFTSLLWIFALIAGVAVFSPLSSDFTDPRNSLDWVRGSIETSLAAAVVVAVIVWQYARRRTSAARTVYGCVIALGSMTHMLPWGTVYSALARPGTTIGLDRQLPSSLTSPALDVVVELPLRMSGVPDGLRARVDGSKGRIENFDGHTLWRGHPVSMPQGSSTSEDADALWLVIHMPRDSFEAVKNEPVRIRTSLFLTLYGNRKSYTLQPQSKAVPIPGVGLCDTEIPQLYFRCQSPFRGARMLVTSPEVSIRPSYTPLPAEMSISPIVNLYGRGGWQAILTPTTLITEEPMEHLRRDLTFDNIRLSDFVR